MKNQITILRGPDRVRKRPAVIFGSDDIEGVQNAVRMLLGLYVNEALLGHCTKLCVSQTGPQLKISGDDRGIYIGQDTKDDTIWKDIFCELYAGDAYAPDESGYRFGLVDASHHTLFGDRQTVLIPDIMLGAIQCATKYLDVQINRGGLNTKLHFEKGYNIGGIHNEATDAPDGTCFCLQMDEEVFTQVTIPEEFFRETLEILAVLHPGLTCQYDNDQTGESLTFFYPGGAAEYVAARSKLPVYHQRIDATGRDRYNRAEYEARVEVVIGYAPDRGEVKCYHNSRYLAYGGKHYEQLQKRLCRAFNSCFFEEEEVTFEELSKHLQIMLITWCPLYCSAWQNGARSGIENRMIADMTYDALGQEFSNYLYANKAALSAMIDVILKERKVADC